MKEEDDLYQVIQYYDIAYENQKTKHSNAENLLWYEEHDIEKCRGSRPGRKPISATLLIACQYLQRTLFIAVKRY